MHPIIIIGSGLAGYNTAKEFRKIDKDTPLSVITSDAGEFYSKPMLSNALAAKKAPESIPINSAQQMTVQLNATIRTRTEVTEIVPEVRQLRMGKEIVSYSKLVLALGADQIRLPLGGSAANAVMSVNGLHDYAGFRTAIEGKEKIVIIGAGLIGCEFANDLSSAGLEVHVVDIADQPLPRLLPAAGGRFLRDRLASVGVAWHLGTSVNTIDWDNAQLRVTLANGQAIAADAILSAVGLKPKLALAQSAGLKVNRGVIVDRCLQSSAADVFALGDCAEVAGLVLPFVMPITHAARALAATLAGKPTFVSYPAMPVLVKTPVCPTIVCPPPLAAQGKWEIENSADGVKSLFVDEAGKLLGFALNGATTAERAKLVPHLPPVLPLSP